MRRSKASPWSIGTAALILLCAAGEMGITSERPADNRPVATRSKTTLNRALIKASASGDLAGISRLLAEGADPNANEGVEGVSALFAAAESNRPDAVKLLLSHGGDPNHENSCGNKPIEWVLDQGNLEMATLLHDAGAKIDPVRWAGATGDHQTLEQELSRKTSNPETVKNAYKFAVSLGRLETVEFIERISGKPIPGSFLTQAAKSGNVAMMEYILSQGADLQNDGGRAIDHAVIFFDQPEAVKFLLKRGIDPNRITEWGDHLVSSAKSAAVIEVLLEAGADPNAEDRRKVPLAAAPDAESVRLLHKHGADLRRSGKPGGSLIEQAIMADFNDRAEVITELVRQGAPFDPQGNGASAIVSAAFFDQFKVVESLLTLGVSPNALSNQAESRSVLASAAVQGSPELLQLLLERGANPNGHPSDSFSPLCMAAMSGKHQNVEVLVKGGATNLGPLSIAAALGDLDQVRERLHAGDDVNQTDPAGLTPLTFAVRRGHPEVARLLLEKGANPSMFSRQGLTPEAYLAFTERPDQRKLQWNLSDEEGESRVSVFKQLFAKYPPLPNYQNAEGRTYLHQAAWFGNPLIWFGHNRPDPNIRDKDGRPALLLACLSPRASDTEERITTYTGSEPTEATAKKWNYAAKCADTILSLGADPELSMPNDQTVRTLGIAAAEKAGNTQLLAILKRAGKVDGKKSP